MTSILMVLTSHDELGDAGGTTGWYLSEAAHPWKVFTSEGYDLSYMSPKGGFAPMDGVDLDDPINVEFLAAVGRRGPETLTPDVVDPGRFDAIFYVGGHGTMWDFPHDNTIANIASSIHESGGVIAAVCHGPAGLLPIEAAGGEKLLAGRRVAGFTNAEEAANGLTDVVPFLLEDALREAGAVHHAGADFESKVVVDGRVATGQNPASATDLAKTLVSLLTSTDEHEGNGGDHNDPRLNEVVGDTGMPGELIGGEENLPGSQAPPPGAEHTGTAISDAKGSTVPKSPTSSATDRPSG